MPVNVPKNLPAIAVLKEENIFLTTEDSSVSQDVNLLVLNLMPLKITTEVQLLRMLSNTALRMQIILLRMQTHVSKNTPAEHLQEFYTTFENIKNKHFDGLIITGAPTELLDFEEVNYWKELQEIMNWADSNVTSTLFICWAAQAALYHHYGVPKYELPEKMFGVFPHTLNNSSAPIVRGFDDEYLVPHSRHTEIRRNDIIKIPALEIVSESAMAGVYLVRDLEKSRIFVTGHSEYDVGTLAEEYHRDISKGMDIKIPYNYFPNNDPSLTPPMRWNSHAALLFANWINYYVNKNKDLCS